jgi:hypothetical protein
MNATREQVGHFLRARGLAGKLDPAACVCQIDLGLADPRAPRRRFQQPATKRALARVDNPRVANPDRLLLRIDVDVGPSGSLTRGPIAWSRRGLLLGSSHVITSVFRQKANLIAMIDPERCVHP